MKKILVLIIVVLFITCGQASNHLGKCRSTYELNFVEIIMGKRSLCTGSILTSRLVLTSARCISSRKQNVLSVKINLPNGREFDSQIIQAFVHEDYNSRDLYSDIAVLLLAKVLPIGEGVQVPLQANTTGDEIGLIPGWTCQRRGSAKDVQTMFTPVKLLPVDECQGIKVRYNTSNSQCFELDSKHICRHDYGAPVLTSSRNHSVLYQIGVLNFFLQGQGSKILGYFTKLDSDNLFNSIKRLQEIELIPHISGFKPFYLG